MYYQLQLREVTRDPDEMFTQPNFYVGETPVDTTSLAATTLESTTDCGNLLLVNYGIGLPLIGRV